MFLDGSAGMQAGHCSNRGESQPLDTASRSLILMNFFPDDPLLSQACRYNSAPLLSMVPTCYRAAGNRWPNYLAVDFYKVYYYVYDASERLLILLTRSVAQSGNHWAWSLQRSDGGGAFAALDVLNAGLMCDCAPGIDSCQETCFSGWEGSRLCLCSLIVITSSFIEDSDPMIRISYEPIQRLIWMV